MKRKLVIAVSLLVALWAVLSIMFMWPPIVHEERATAPGSACLNNLRMIESAKEQWATANSKPYGAPVVVQDIDRYALMVWPGFSHPICQDNGTYTYGDVGLLPVCSLADVEPKRVRTSLFTWKWYPSRGHKIIR